MVNCGSIWGEASGIVIKSGCKEPSGQSVQNVVIEHNVIDAPEHPHGIFLSNVDGVRLLDNYIRTAREGIVMKDCIHIS